MGCGNNCAGCACDSEVLEITPEQERIKKLEAVLSQISLYSLSNEWAKADLGRLAIDALKGTS